MSRASRHSRRPSNAPQEQRGGSPMSTDTNEQQHDPESLKGCIERGKDRSSRVGELVGGGAGGVAGLVAGGAAGAATGSVGAAVAASRGGVVGLALAAPIIATSTVAGAVRGAAIGVTEGSHKGEDFAETEIGRNVLGTAAGVALKVRVAQRNSTRKLVSKRPRRLIPSRFSKQSTEEV